MRDKINQIKVYNLPLEQAISVLSSHDRAFELMQYNLAPFEFTIKELVDYLTDIVETGYDKNFLHPDDIIIACALYALYTKDLDHALSFLSQFESNNYCHARHVAKKIASSAKPKTNSN